ncbi:MAG: hypothetical protein RLN78_12640 [Phycisphaerales bacterium]
MEQLGSVVGELDRVGSAADDLLAEIDGVGESERDQILAARMFAHEVNNLVMGISGRAQRALMSGDPGLKEEAIGVAADLGARVQGLCSAFLQTGDGGFDDRSEMLQILDTHEFASNIATECLANSWVRWVVEVDDEECFGGVPMGPGMLGQVLVNLYRNAIGGIVRGLDDAGLGGGACVGVVRLRVMRFGGDGVLVRVEDSGVGFGGGGCVSGNESGKLSGNESGNVSGNVSGNGVGGGYGLGLKVCRELCGRCGGRVEIGTSAMLGGGRVDVVFD